jgi:hypothetical protein
MMLDKEPLLLEKNACPHCGRAVEEIIWERSVLRTRLGGDGREIPYPMPDRLISVANGICRLLPCGHPVPWEVAEEIERAWRDQPSPMQFTLPLEFQ